MGEVEGPHSPGTSIAAGSYSFVEEESVAAGGYRPAPLNSLPAPFPGSGQTRLEQRPAVLTWTERERICDRIAHFLLRALEGDHRGASGRDEIPLASRLWLVARSYDGQCFRPLLVYRRFCDCKSLVKRGADLGSSVFIGIPSEREGRRIAATSGLGWPESF